VTLFLLFKLFLKPVALVLQRDYDCCLLFATGAQVCCVTVALLAVCALRVLQLNALVFHFLHRLCLVRFKFLSQFS
jgi:hypothetical protein